MKKILLVLFLGVFSLYSLGTNFSVVNVGFTFSPAEFTIAQTDVVTFTLDNIHDAVEVSQSTWDADGISPVIGFRVPFGGGTLLGSELAVGIHYYVCENHASMGMKGTIIVQGSQGIFDHNVQNNILIYPNPAKDQINVRYNPSSANVVEIKLFNFQGKLVNVLLSKTEVSGLFQRSFPLNNMAGPGIYFVQIVCDEVTSYQKVVIL